MTGPETLAALVMGAGLTWRQHQPQRESWAPGTCRQCTPTGCGLLEWATAVRAGRVMLYPTLGDRLTAPIAA